MRSQADPRSRARVESPGWLPLAAAAALFGLSRLAYRAAGVRFDATPLAWFWQYVDPVLLRTDLARSLVHLHSQPPLFNLFLGLVLKACPGHLVAACEAVYALLGLGLALALCRVLMRLGVRREASVALAALFAASPACVIYEHWLFYDYPVAALLCFAALALHGFASSGRGWAGAAFFALLGCLALTRSLFHLAWLAVVAGLVLVGMPGRRRRVAAACAVPLLAVALWYGKNLWLFGQFTSSTWLGMNVARITTLKVPRERRAEMVARGTLSPLALVAPFRPLEAYEPCLAPLQPAGVRVLDQRRKRIGAPNFHHAAYIDVAGIYLRDAVAVVRHRPRAYLRGLFDAWVRYFMPATDYFWVRGNRQKVAGLDRAWSVALGRVRFDPWPQSEEVVSEESRRGPGRKALNAALVLVVACPVLTVYGLVVGFRALRRGGEGRALGLTVLFACVTIVYVTVVGNALEVGENHRNRFALGPLYVVLLGLFLARRLPSVAGREAEA
ncbi:MAG: hypothetical protein ACLF0G_18305 [Candidatus Brocadiia bacterium]